jgi:hypothetical protein
MHLKTQYSNTPALQHSIARMRYSKIMLVKVTAEAVSGVKA